MRAEAGGLRRLHAVPPLRAGLSASGVGCSNLAGFVENFGRPLIQAFARGLRCDQCGAMYFGWNPQHELAGRRLFRSNTLLLAVTHELFDSRLERGSQLDNCFTMKADDRAQAKNLPHKDVVEIGRHFTTPWEPIVSPQQLIAGAIGETQLNKLSVEVARILRTPDFRAKLSSQGLDPLISSPDQLSALMKSDTACFSGVIKSANIRLDN